MIEQYFQINAIIHILKNIDIDVKINTNQNIDAQIKKNNQHKFEKNAQCSCDDCKLESYNSNCYFKEWKMGQEQMIK